VFFEKKHKKCIQITYCTLKKLHTALENEIFFDQKKKRMKFLKD